MMNGTLRSGLNQVFGDWSRLFYGVSIIASIAAAAWYLDDRGSAKVAHEVSGIESRLDKLDQRVNERIAELTRSVDAVNQRLDRMLEMQLELNAQRRR